METIIISEPQSKKLSMGSKRGRPKLDCKVHQIRFTLSLREGEDDDLLFFFSDIPERRRAAALKAGGLPCTREELQNRFKQFLDQQMRGHDAANTRLTLDQ